MQVYGTFLGGFFFKNCQFSSVSKNFTNILFVMHCDYAYRVKKPRDKGSLFPKGGGFKGLHALLIHH